MVGVALDGRHLRRRPYDTRSPGGRVLEVSPGQVIVGQLLTGRPRVGERALGKDALIDAGVGVGDLLLHERAARAAGPDREAQRAVGLDQVLLGHHQRLGLEREVAVVTGVVKRG